MTRTCTRTRRDERGSALVELPLAFVAIAAFALCLTALGQLLLDYHHLSGAARSAARFATKADHDPTLSPPSASRRPSSEQVVAHAKDAAAPLPGDEVDVALVPDDIAGDGVTVEVRHMPVGGAYGLVTTTANRLLALVGAGPLPDVTLRATSTALYE